MALNTTLASLSDTGFEAAVAGYIVALGCFAVELASRRTAPAERAPAMALTADGTPGGRPVVPTAGPAGGIGLVDRSAQTPWAERFGKAGVVVAAVAFLANLFSIVTRGLATERMPLGNLYEFLSVITTVATGSMLFVVFKTKDRSLGTFVMLPVALLAMLIGTVLYTPAGELMASLNHYWLTIHVSAISVSSGVLLFSGIASVAYLVREKAETKALAGRTPVRGEEVVVPATSIWSRLPSSDALDRIAYRTAILAFPVFTFAVVGGALWAEVAWGRYWGWDPKEIGAFLTWVVYACYLHARATAGWRGSRAAWISVLGFVTVNFNLFFVNFIPVGLHSYA